ncbi:hypothetical protein [Paenibacillus sp. Root52]|uniref:hypothetical protein n=1 Tax=Paenibacillus sp. Root52 TaxID=1736552 RepID=UPI000A8D7D74|nr:hypothetical protein [Paenibacillus sp. Root52]
MITVTCIDNREAGDLLTEGKEYQAISSDGENITIKNNNNGNELPTLTCRFELYVSSER